MCLKFQKPVLTKSRSKQIRDSSQVTEELDKKKYVEAKNDKEMQDNMVKIQIEKLTNTQNRLKKLDPTQYEEFNMLKHQYRDVWNYLLDNRTKSIHENEAISSCTIQFKKNGFLDKSSGKQFIFNIDNVKERFNQKDLADFTDDFLKDQQNPHENEDDNCIDEFKVNKDEVNNYVKNQILNKINIKTKNEVGLKIKEFLVNKKKIMQEDKEKDGQMLNLAINLAKNMVNKDNQDKINTVSELNKQNNQSIESYYLDDKNFKDLDDTNFIKTKNQIKEINNTINDNTLNDKEKTKITHRISTKQLNNINSKELNNILNNMKENDNNFQQMRSRSNNDILNDSTIDELNSQSKKSKKKLKIKQKNNEKINNNSECKQSDKIKKDFDDLSGLKLPSIFKERSNSTNEQQEPNRPLDPMYYLQNHSKILINPRNRNQREKFKESNLNISNVRNHTLM